MSYDVRVPWDMNDGRFWEPVECTDLFLMFDAHVSDGVPDVPVAEVLEHVAECDKCSAAWVTVSNLLGTPRLDYDW